MTNSNKALSVALAAVIAAGTCGSAIAQTASTKPAVAPNPNAPANAQPQAATPEAVFAHWDKDNNKALSLDEFRAGWGEVQQANALRKLHANFVAMDANKSGALEQNEYANLELIKKAGAKAPMMSAFDADKDGKLQFKEYVGMIGTMVKNK